MGVSFKYPSPDDARVARKISFEEFRGRGTIQRRPQVSTPCPSTPFSGVPTPPASEPESPCEALALRRVNAPKRPKPLPKPRRSPAAAAAPAVSAVSAATTPISEPEEEFSLFNEPVEEPVNKAAIEAAEREARREDLVAHRQTSLACREIALARSSNVTKRAAGSGANRMVNARKQFKAIDKARTSVSRRVSKKPAAGKAPKSKSGLSKLSSGPWIDVKTRVETSSASLEASRLQREQQQQQPLSAKEKAIKAKRAAELEKYRRETAKTLDAAGNTQDGRIIGVIGDGITMGFRDERKERPKEDFPMWTTQQATERAMGGINQRSSRGWGAKSSGR